MRLPDICSLGAAKVLGLIVFSFFCSTPTFSQSLQLDVSSIDSRFQLSPYVHYLRLPATESVDPASVLAEEFLALPNNEISFGYTADQFWFHFESVNSSENPIELVLDTNVKFMEPLLIYEIGSEGSIVELLRGDESQPFAERPLSTPKLTLPLSWQPGESKRLLFYVRSGSGVDMSLELGTRAWVTEKYSNNRTFFALLVGILSTLILINLFHYYAVRRTAHLVYALQEAAILLFMLHIDGLAFQYLWPESPEWNAHATMVFGHLVNLMALLFAISFLELKTRAPFLYRLIAGIAVIAFSMLLLTPFVEPRFSDLVGLATSGLGGLLLVGTGLFVAFKGYRPARYFVAGWAFMSMGTLLYGLANLAVISLPLAPIVFLRAGVLGEALLLSFGLSDQLKTLDEAARRAQGKLLESTRERLEEAQVRIQLEQARHDAEKDLIKKDLDIARARHDIRQPIFSLRLALLADEKRAPDSPSREVIDQALDYMEELLKENSGEDFPAETTLISYGDFFTQVQGEFIGSATEKSVEFKIVPSSLDMSVPVVPMKRVVANLVANALRHAKASRLLIGLRRQKNGVTIMVLDNGIGMPESESATLAETRGEGLGLGIVKALCKEHNWSFDFTSKANRGSCFRIGVVI